MGIRHIAAAADLLKLCQGLIFYHEISKVVYCKNVCSWDKILQPGKVQFCQDNCPQYYEYCENFTTTTKTDSLYALSESDDLDNTTQFTDTDYVRHGHSFANLFFAIGGSVVVLFAVMIVMMVIICRQFRRIDALKRQLQVLQPCPSAEAPTSGWDAERGGASGAGSQETVGLLGETNRATNEVAPCAHSGQNDGRQSHTGPTPLSSLCACLTNNLYQSTNPKRVADDEQTKITTDTKLSGPKQNAASTLNGEFPECTRTISYLDLREDASVEDNQPQPIQTNSNGAIYSNKPQPMLGETKTSRYS